MKRLILDIFYKRHSQDIHKMRYSLDLPELAIPDMTKYLIEKFITLEPMVTITTIESNVFTIEKVEVIK